jgi:hypothetical protein
MLLKVIGYSSLTSVLSIQSSSSKAKKVMFLPLTRQSSIQLRVSYEINYSHPCLMKMEKKKKHFVTQIPTHIICNAAYHIQSMHELLEDSLKKN